MKRLFIGGLLSLSIVALGGAPALAQSTMYKHHAILPPNDPLFSSTYYSGSAQPVGQWYLKPNMGEVQSALNAQTAWSYTQGDKSIVIAVLDTGVLFDHPDLQRVTQGGKLLAGYDFVSADSDGGFVRANDGDGWDSDTSDPGDWVNSSLVRAHHALLQDCSLEQSSWHGTRTAGLIGAIAQNVQGIAGVDWNAKILPVRVLGRCGGRLSDIVAGIRWAAGLHVDGVPDNPTPARVISLSLGNTTSCSAVEQAAIDEVRARGVVVVASAGNGQGAVESPANCQGVIAVAGLRHNGTKVGFSSLGAEVAISAPAGNCINGGINDACLYSIDTLTNTGTTIPAINTTTTQFDSNVGTSFSAPLVAGVVGLLLSLNPRLTPDQVKSLLQSTTNPFPSDPSLPICPTLATGTDNDGQCNCTTTQCGAGMLNALAAVNQANPANCLFDWAERNAASTFPSHAVSQTQDIYQYRYYGATQSYLATTADTGQLLYLSPQGLLNLGARTDWFARAGCI